MAVSVFPAKFMSHPFFIANCSILKFEFDGARSLPPTTPHDTQITLNLFTGYMSHSPLHCHSSHVDNFSVTYYILPLCATLFEYFTCFNHFTDMLGLLRHTCWFNPLTFSIYCHCCIVCKIKGSGPTLVYYSSSTSCSIT